MGGFVKNRCGLLVHDNPRLLYLKNDLMNWADFFHADIYSERLKGIGFAFSSALSHERIDELSWFFSILIHIRKSLKLL